MTNPVLVHALRGSTVESFHRGALAIVDADGAVVRALGDIDRPVFPRSACKALQALPLVASGAADAFGLDDAELAMACASHSGEPGHVATAASALAKAGLDVNALECGAHWPYHDGSLKALAREGREPTALNNNCSGKHAGFVCLGCLMARERGLDARGFVRGYVQPDHPVMREITASLAAATGADYAHAPVGTDGCSIPTYAVPLRALALGFARFGTGTGLPQGFDAAAARLRRAVAASPFHVSGSNGFDTRVQQRLGERVFCKVGAEGMYCASVPARGIGIALKMDDGNNARAAEVVMAALIEALVTLDDDERGFMAGLSQLTLRNWNRIEVGGLAASPGLRDALA
ncbi:MAG: asparaginase [Aquabacterium sp.]